MATDQFFGGWKLPLSGDVTQEFNPWFWWRNSIGQLGFININEMKVSDSEVEREIIENVAGYGKQLGRIGEALSVLLKHTRLPDLRPGEQQALREFAEMASEIAAVKSGHEAPTEENLDRFVDGIRYLKDRDPVAYQRILERLRKEVFDERSPSR